MTDELTEAFRKLKQRDVDTFGAKVVSVNKEQGTCIVADDNLQYTNVRLSSVINGSNKKFFLFPKVGSSVLVSPINEDLKQLYVEAYSEIESLELTILNTYFKIDANGFLLKKENETLKGLIGDLIGAIRNMSFTVATTGSPSSHTGETQLLNNSAEFSMIENRFNQLLNDV